MIKIRPFASGDWPATWDIIEPVFRAGETYALSPDISEQEAYRFWIEKPDATFVAEAEAGGILGTYFIRPNQPAQGAHICNCGYIVAGRAQGRGIGAELCRHSQHEAVARGFIGMQFNLVVSTNKGAVKLWEKLGFTIAGTLPRAFRHPGLGFVDAYVMVKQLA